MLDFLLNWGYIGLFVASFLAATILPFSSEVVFAGLIAAGLDIWICIIVATIGNSLGGMTAYWVGSLGKIEWIEKYFGIKREKIDKTHQWLQGKGSMMGFFAFVPGIGDVIMVALGFMRANFWKVAIFMTIGKFLRYIAVGFGTEQILLFF
ncbi:MAG: YqaA family protein [Dysgonamonadaceae bacterium]|jgi:membrane protein YqaA with SNARE-associated domain|nr:DedA family protein [Dysgonamonadaceae bacterium]MDD3494709.1 DedA family protein [Dysgonamonadaceae bacterium]MDD4378424.1 DedA family protein [Dysgonamonadaceae bacterium]NLH28734.1 DedA family protein [Bacteroidales bacterium]HXL00571.1 YqaA family protein [Dysgonamonadaceae bacterium]